MSDETAIKLHSTTDAVEWAQEFCRRFSLYTEDGVVMDPHGLMLGWFANAIEVGRSAGLRDAEPADDDMHPLAARYRPPAVEPSDA